MSDEPVSPQLLHPHHTVLILRLTLDPQHKLYQGIVIDRDEQVVGQFRTWPELIVLLQQWTTLQSLASSAA